MINLTRLNAGEQKELGWLTFVLKTLHFEENTKTQQA